MTVGTKFRAVIQLHNDGIDHNDLKRLAMLFDEIYFIEPTVFTLTDAFIQKETLFEEKGRSLQFPDFDFLKDTETGHFRTNMRMQSQLKETLSVFQEKGIAKDISQKLLTDDFFSIRNYFASHDSHDTTFNELSETLPHHYDPAGFSLSQMVVSPVNQLGIPIQSIPLFIFLDNPPNSILDSYEISATLYASQMNSSFPVFLHPRLKKIMEYRYLQY